MDNTLSVELTSENRELIVDLSSSNKSLDGVMSSQKQLDTSISAGVVRIPPSKSAIEKAVETYFAENPVVIIPPSAKLGEVTLLADAWVGTNSLYSQVVSIEGVTEHSQVDLTPDVEQLAVFYEKDLTFVTENEDGVVTVYAIGQKPTNDYTIQVTITEVSA
jgi:hypothetical protein